MRFDWINRYLWYWLPFIKSSLKAMISSNKSIASDKCVVVIRKNKPIIGMCVPIKTCKVRKQQHHLKGLTNIVPSTYLNRYLSILIPMKMSMYHVPFSWDISIFRSCTFNKKLPPKDFHWMVDYKTLKSQLC